PGPAYERPGHDCHSGGAGSRRTGAAPARQSQYRGRPARNCGGAAPRGRLRGRSRGQCRILSSKERVRSASTSLARGRPGGNKSGGEMKHTTIGEIVRGDREIFPPYLYEAYQSTRRRAPTMPLIEVPLTLSELTGPGPAISAITPEDADLTRNAGTGG